MAASLAALVVLAGLALWKGPFLLRMARAPSPPPLTSNAVTGAKRTSTGGWASASREANDYFERGILFTEVQFDLPKAQQMFEHALALDPKFIEARAWHGANSMGMVDNGLSNDSTWLYKAEEELHQVLDEEPNSAVAYCGLAGVYFHQGRRELMLSVIEKSLKAAPELRCANNWLAIYHQFKGNNAVAKGTYRHLLDKTPLYGSARWNLADTLRTEGELEVARREVEMLLEQNPNDDGDHMLLSRIYSDSGDFGKAQSVLQTIHRPSPQEFYVRFAWARLHAAEGKRSEALHEMDESLLKFLELNKWFTLEAAEVYAAVGQTDKALEWLERAVNGGDERVEWFRRDPMLKNIRNHSRFQQILASASARRQQRGLSAH